MSGGSVVLLSGGLDSATTLALAVRDTPPAHALTVRYGQRHRIEVERAAEIAGALGAASHRTVDLDLTFLSGSALTDRSIPAPTGRHEEEMADEVPNTYVPARNTVFLSLALAWAEALDAGSLWIGANAVDYSGYPDCRPEFIAPTSSSTSPKDSMVRIARVTFPRFASSSASPTPRRIR